MDKSKETQGAIDALRNEIDAVSDEIDWTESSPVPKDELRQRIVAGCKSLGDQFDLALIRLSNPLAGAPELREILTLQSNAVFRGEGGSGIANTDIHLGGLLAAVFGEELTKRLCKKAEDLSYTAGPPIKDRREIIDRLRQTLHDLETSEEALICDAEDCGVYIARRADADPAIVLSYNPGGDSPDIGPRAICAPLPFENRPSIIPIG